MTTEVVDPIVSVASWLLPGAPRITPPGGPEAAMGLVEQARSARLLGPLLLAVEAAEVDLGTAATAALVEHHLEAQLWCVKIETRLLEVRDWFQQAGGVEHLVIKGSAVAHLDELDPSLRSFADLDLLVAGADVDRAVAALQAQGATRPWAERRRGYDRRFAKSVTLTSGGGVEVDLHRSLVDGAFGFRIPLDRIFAEPDHFELGGEQVAVPNAVHRLLHAAYHAVLGSPTPRLMSLRDIAGYLVRPELGPEQVVPEAVRWRGRAVLAKAVREVRSTLPVPLPGWDEWSDGEIGDAAETRLLDRQRSEGSSLGPAKLDALQELPDVRSKLAYGLALAAPSRTHLRSRGLRRRDLLRRS